MSVSNKQKPDEKPKFKKRANYKSKKLNAFEIEARSKKREARRARVVWIRAELKRIRWINKQVFEARNPGKVYVPKPRIPKPLPVKKIELPPRPSNTGFNLVIGGVILMLIGVIVYILIMWKRKKDNPHDYE
jgi:hypothetical protein